MKTSRDAAERGRRARGKNGPIDLAVWLETRIPLLRDLWWEEIRRRGLGQRGGGEGLIERFVVQLVEMLPQMLGPRRDQVEPHWVRVAELFGAVSAKRGLAAGEVMEEIHLLRELVIRELYRDPPNGGLVPLSLREVLRLNRALDSGVTHASVGHTDEMFFDLFQGERPPGAESRAGNDEAEAQLESTRREVERLRAPQVDTPNGEVPEP